MLAILGVGRELEEEEEYGPIARTQKACYQI
jgi:hypothetical protein